ncbi:phosphoglycerate kinase [Candidatus Microgenomates bacterium]|nr:phosphoglycerate kinase [Candidatus Microgenomates bacterium]
MNKLSSLKNKLKGKTVLMRVDFNVVLDDGFQVSEDTRIIETVPAIKFLLENQAKVVLVFHLGRPKGKVDPRLSVKPILKRTAEHLKQKITLIDKFWQKDALKQIKNLKQGQIAMLENIRFCPGEEQNDVQFSKHLSLMADIFVNEAFGAAHRAHASTVGVTNFLPSYAGFLIEKEIKILSEAINNPKRPLVMIIGGAKTPEKIAVIARLLGVADTILLGGAVANTFFATWGVGTGDSLVDHEMIESARACFWKATRATTALLLPTDVVVVNTKTKKNGKVVNYKRVTKNYAIYDIGPRTQRLYAKHIKNAGTIIWNGPMGVYEKKEFTQGTNFLLKEVSDSWAFSILGGGDTLSSIKDKKLLEGFSYLSTGGGAMLEFLERGTLPAIEPLC